MLNKEIEKAINSMKAFVCTDSLSCVTAKEMKLVLEYIEQLETENTTNYNNYIKTLLERDKQIEANKMLLENKQKLIKKLEEDIRNANDNIKHMDEKNILQTIARELAIGTRDYTQEILKIMKGDKQC